MKSSSVVLIVVLAVGSRSSAEPAFPLRAGIARAVDALKTGDRSLPARFPAPAEDAVFAFAEEIITLQEDVSLAEYRLRGALEDLNRLQAGSYREETSRWQATYDFTLARLERRIAYLAAYNYSLALFRKQLRGDQVPPNGWRLVVREGLPEDRDAHNAARAAQTRLDALTNRHKGTPWEWLARRELLTPNNMEWQPAEK